VRDGEEVRGNSNSRYRYGRACLGHNVVWTCHLGDIPLATCSPGDSGTARIEQSCAPKDAGYARVQGAMTMKTFAGMMAFAIALIGLAILSALALYGDVDILPGQRNFIRLAPLDAASQSAATVACVGSLR
jgi:hypothetical protein